MAVTLVFKKTLVEIDAVVLDASVSETHATEVEITEHPVERGVNIVDHKRRKPATLTIEGMVSNTPIPDASSPLTRRNVGSVEYDSRSEMVPARAGQAYADLLELADSDRLFTVVTGLRVYENMAIKSLSVPRDARTGQVLRFTINLMEVKLVTSKVVNVEAKAKAKTNLGKRAGSTTPEPQKAKSFLKQLADTNTGNRLLQALGAR